MKEMDIAFLGFEPGSILAFQDLHTTDVTTSTLPEKLGHLVEVNQRGYNASYLYTVGRNTLRVFLLPTVRLDGFQGDEVTGCVGEALDPPGT